MHTIRAEIETRDRDGNVTKRICDVPLTDELRECSEVIKVRDGLRITIRRLGA